MGKEDVPDGQISSARRVKKCFVRRKTKAIRAQLKAIRAQLKAIRANKESHTGLWSSCHMGTEEAKFKIMGVIVGN